MAAPGFPLPPPAPRGGPVPRAGRAAPCQLAQPASPAGSGPAPACLLPRLPGHSPLRALLPVPCGAARGMDGAGWVLWDGMGCYGVGWGAVGWDGAAGTAGGSPARRPSPAAPHPHFKTLSRPTHIHHPAPLASFRMQLNTSALKISGANCLVMKTLITGQLKP